MDTLVKGLYVGRVQALPGDGRPTGIFKQFNAGPLQVRRDGFIDDVQADRRVHGGPDKAVHQFPAEHYAKLAAQFPEQSAAFVPGSIGENLSTDGLDESQVCIGDVYALGSAQLQLCQPRTPCWKIDARYDGDGITTFIAQHGISGWYYRVLKNGSVRVGDALVLIERPAVAVSLREFWTVLHDHRPSTAVLQRVIQAQGLAEGWRRHLQQRFDWLRRHGE